jgi:glycine/D-amino acid oxidase-like deaminating enzyme
MHLLVPSSRKLATSKRILSTVFVVLSSSLTTSIASAFISGNNVIVRSGSFNSNNISHKRSLWASSHYSTSLNNMANAATVVPKNIVVIGGGIQGASVAYHLATSKHFPSDGKVTILESQKLASAASGKGGGFMARSWGDGSVTQRLHELAFDMYEELASPDKLDISTYRKLPVLSVSPGKGGVAKANKAGGDVKEAMPEWLDGNTGAIRMMGYGDDTAQVTPIQVVEQFVSKAGADKVEVCLGTATGVETTDVAAEGDGDNDNKQQVTGVKYTPLNGSSAGEEQLLECDAVVISAGPWSCIAEDWFQGVVQLPMEGVKSTSIVWSPPTTAGEKGEVEVDATALFCGEDNRFGTHCKFVSVVLSIYFKEKRRRVKHLTAQIHVSFISVPPLLFYRLLISDVNINYTIVEVYPRPDNTIYLCGIGGSDYIPADELKQGAFRENCPAKEARVEAAQQSFMEMSAQYRSEGKLQQAQACMRPCPPDALPYMGSIPGFEGAYINAGHNCWGIAWAPACGLAMAELVLEGECHSVNLQPFDPARFVPTKRGRGRKNKGVSVGEQW